MGNLKSYIRTLALAVTAAAGMTACQDCVDDPSSKAPESTLQPNTKLMELKTMFWSEDKNYADTIRDDADPERRFIIHGTVISSDEEGNIFKSLIIQDETAALAFSIDSYNLYLRYRRGQEVVLDVTGLEIGKYAGLQQIGRKSWYENGKSWQVSFMAPETFYAHAELNGYPNLAECDTLVFNTFSEISQQTPENLRRYQSRLVRFKNVSFTEGGQRKLSVWHTKVNEEQNTTIVDRNNASLTVRTSGYSTFFNTTLPVGNIDIVGILSYYNDSWQLMLLDGDGLIRIGERPGTKDKPYTVDQAIADESAGVTDEAWVKGYIVGTLAPEVEESVSSDNDIQFVPPFVISTSLVIASSADCTDYSKCIVVPVAMESALQQYGNLASNPGNLGKEILVKGNLGKYLGTWGLTGNTGKADSFEIEGVTVDDGSVGNGDGSKEKPFNCAQIVAMNPQSTTDAVQSGVWVEGYIVGSMPTGGSSTVLSATNFSTTDAATTNLVLGPTADCTDYTKCVGVQLPSAMRGELALANKPGNLGKKLAVKGDIMKYCGGPGVKNLTENRLGEGSGTPDNPDTPSVEPSGDGTLASPYNATKALQLARALDENGSIENVYVTGKIASVTEVSTQFGNATYTITDGGATFSIYRGYWLNGDKFTSADQIKVGAEVVVNGTLVNFKGNTPQMTTGSKIVSYDGTGAGGDTPVTPPAGDAVTVTASSLTVPGTTTVDGYTIGIEQMSGATAPMIHSSGNVRMYADNQLTVSCSGKIAKIVFEIASSNSYRYTTFAPSTGKLDPAQAEGDTSVTWVGDASSVTFTVGHDATLGSDGSGKRGQIHFSKILIYPAE